MAFAFNSLSLVFFASLLFSFAVLTQQSSTQKNGDLQSSNDCVYTVYTQTGANFGGGTDSNISLALHDAYGDDIVIPNLVKWGGIMGPKHDYFERNNLDAFSNLGGCLKGPVCKMKLTSDGTGSGSDWYVNYVQVTATGPHIPCSQKFFTIERWLALDEPPNTLTVTKNLCPNVTSSASI
ncbi:hypothetical protein MKX01_040600 [Papaver californicum]|nr:hypothetical protein MKX01_040600 [Papaver californicum]